MIRRLVAIGALESDPEELRVRKTVLLLSATLMASLASVWVITYAVLGLWVPAAIPLAYQLASFASIAVFARTRRYSLFRRSQLWMSLLLPFALQWSLGGFRASSAVGLWAISSPLGALLFVGAREAMPWFAGFALLTAISGALDPTLTHHAHDVPNGIVVTFFVLNIGGVASTAWALLQYFVRARERALADLAAEQAKSERLLLNVLPEPVAARLKDEAGTIADSCHDVTVLFADIVGFTPLAERLPPADLVALLDRVFAHWDVLAAAHGVEKIKTIGDAYMAAAGIPLPRADHAAAVADMALAMRAGIERVAAAVATPLETRIGIASGPVVAGVIGRAKFSYDLWGDTVNTASRMESHALPGTIQVAEGAYRALRERYDFSERGLLEIKGKGLTPAYVLLGPRASDATAYDERAHGPQRPMIRGTDRP